MYMPIKNINLRGFLCWVPRLYKHISTVNNKGSHKLCNHFAISQNKAEFICLKQPYVNKLDDSTLERLIETIRNLGFTKEVLIQHAQLFSIMPNTLKYRHKVLKECGFENVTPNHLSSYLPLMKQKTIAQLKISGDIPSLLNVEHRLASFMTKWHVSLNNSIKEDTATLYSLRLKILQQYLESVLEMTEDEFHQRLKTYPVIKHRPLGLINETLNILQSVVLMTNKKIKSNLYLIHVDPDNLKEIIYKLRTIGGIDCKEIIRLYPKLATKTYNTLVEIRNVLQEYNISDEAQRRCFHIYTLSPETIRARFEEAKLIPEFQAFSNHPRFLKIIYYKNTAMHRLRNSQSNGKKCLSLNILSGSTQHYKVYENSPGDRLGKSKDLVFCISQLLEGYSCSEIWRVIKRHPFWYTVPLVEVKSVYKLLSKNFGVHEIYENCTILLYPWKKINNILDTFERQPKNLFHDLVDVQKLNKSQLLSLILYILEKNHYFTGNGVWSDEKCKNIKEMTIHEDLKYKDSINKTLN